MSRENRTQENSFTGTIRPILLMIYRVLYEGKQDHAGSLINDPEKLEEYDAQMTMVVAVA